MPINHLVSRIIEVGYDDPPEGVDLVSWFTCAMMIVLLEEKGIVVSNDELAGMASVVMAFISESGAMDTLRSRFDRPVIAPQRRKNNRK